MQQALASVYVGTLIVALATSPVAAQNCDGVPSVNGTSVTTELVSSAFSDPVDVVAPPGDLERIFVVEKQGRIRIVDIDTYDVQPTGEPFLDIQARVTAGGERGLLGLAFHPDYETNGYFYVNYTRSAGSVCAASPPPGCTGDRRAETVIARFKTFDDDADHADADSELEVLSFCQPYSNHNAGQIHFGPLDGYLYIATGDGGSGGDPCRSGQRMESLLGKMLRIDVDSAEPYAIPADNPFVTEEQDPTGEILDEIWALGLRNPWRFSFDPANGDIYVADVGQGLWEEVNYTAAADAGGENYEWRRREGDHTFDGSETITAGTVHPNQPILEYPHSGGSYNGRSITGGVVYRGCAMPDLRGTYFFADYDTHFIRSFRVVDGEVAELTNRTSELNSGIVPDRLDDISAFGVDGYGEMYICDLGSKLFKVVPLSVDNPPNVVIETDPTPAELELVDGGAEIVLDGSASDDGDGGGQELTYLWEQLGGPDSAELQTPTEATTVASFIDSGAYEFRLTVSDGNGFGNATVDVEVTEPPPPPPRFRRGDGNQDQGLDVSDGVFLLNHLFLGSPSMVPCQDSLDADDDGVLLLTDTIFLLNYLFLGGGVIPEPLFDCGEDPTNDDPLGCDEYPCL